VRSSYQKESAQVPKENDIKSYNEILEEYPDEYLDCRVDRHAWMRPKLIDPWLAVPYGWPVYRECSSCGAFWARSYNRMMTEKIYERRVYPPGYLLKGVGHNTKKRGLQFVRELIEREGTIYIDGDS
jgi:hypothetical protein